MKSCPLTTLFIKDMKETKIIKNMTEEKEKKTAVAQRHCPHCGKQLSVETVVCPKCHRVFHWKRNNDNTWVRFLQSPFPMRVLMIGFILAAVGQVFLLLTDATIAEIIPYPAHYNRFAGHLLKMAGETILLYGLMYGLRFECYRLTIVTVPLVIFEVLYHLMAAGWQGIARLTFLHPYIFQTFYAIVLVLVIFEGLYLVLGMCLASLYRGYLSKVGLLMTASAGMFLLLNVVLHLSGKNLAADVTVSLLNWFCQFFIWDMLLDHRSYMEVPSSRSEMG